MEKITMRTGLILSLIGIIAFVGTGASSPTALIPTLFGVLLVVAGLLARRRSFYSAAMYGAALLSLVGLLGCLIPLSLQGAEASVNAMITQGLMALLCGVLVVLHGKALFRARGSATLRRL